MMRIFREETQLTLRDLALLLGVSHTLIAMDEKGLRFLPGVAEKKLEMLEKTWKALQKDKSRKIGSLPEELKEKGQALAKKNQTTAKKIKKELERLEDKLEALRVRYQVLQQRLEFLQVTRAAVETKDPIAAAVEQLTKRTVSSMKSCCPAIQQLLEIDQKTLAFKHKELIKLANSLSTSPVTKTAQ
ncbi:hypothetical protein [Niabella drilacis]|nr:hypothetical protein [Niabella drilacis]